MFNSVNIHLKARKSIVNFTPKLHDQGHSLTKLAYFISDKNIRITCN